MLLDVELTLYEIAPSIRSSTFWLSNKIVIPSLNENLEHCYEVYAVIKQLKNRNENHDNMSVFSKQICNQKIFAAGMLL